MQIFLPRRHPASDMPLLLVHIKNCTHFGGHRRVELCETLCNIFMYRTLADSKFFRRLPDRRLVFNDIICNTQYPLFYIFFQGRTPEDTVFTVYERGYAVILS